MAAMAAMTVVGCSQNDITEVSPDANPVVGFSAYTGVQSRGVVIDLDSLKKTGFGVLAYYTGQVDWDASFKPNFMWDQKVAYASNAWTYTPVKYWPNTPNDQVSFFAYGPTTDNNGIVPSGADVAGAKLAFTLKNSGSEDAMVDLVVADKRNQKKTDPTINFVFKHALARVSFKAKLENSLVGTTNPDGKTHVVITGVTLLANNNIASISSNLFASGTYDFADGSWDGVLDTSDYELSEDKVLKPFTTLEWGTNPSKVTTTSKGIEVPQAATSVDLFKDKQFLFLIPVNGSTGIDATNQFVVKLDYDIVTEDNKLALGYSITPSTANIVLTNGTLKQGKAYNYTFTIGLTEVKVAATVSDDWVSDSSGDITTPNQTPDDGGITPPDPGQLPEDDY